jgi:hypothetical protein
MQKFLIKRINRCMTSHSNISTLNSNSSFFYASYSDNPRDYSPGFIISFSKSNLNVPKVRVQPLLKWLVCFFLEGEISNAIIVYMRYGWLPEKAIYRKKPERVPSLRIRADGPVILRVAIILGDTASSGKFLMEILSPTTWSKIIFDKTTLITMSRFSDMPNPAVLRYPHPEGVKTRLKPNLHNRWR